MNMFLFRVTIIFTIILTTVSQSPEVEFHFSEDISEYDFLNDTTALLTNANPSFDLHCRASYPIEWVPIYSKNDDGTQEQTKQAIYERTVEEFTNKSTYTYAAELVLRYKGKVFVSTTFSCRATAFEGSAVPQTNVAFIPNEDGRTLLLVKHHDVVVVEPPPKERSCSIYASVSGIGTLQPCWTCFTANGTEEQLDFFDCASATECNSKHRRQNRGKHCLIVKKDGEDNGNCKTDGKLDFEPQGIICKHFGPALAQLYYFGLPPENRTENENEGPTMYFDWTDMPPEKMLRIQNISQDVFVKQEVSLTCDLSIYYFAYGAWFGIQADKESIEYYNEDNRFVGKGSGIFQTTLVTNFSSPGLWTVFCFAPVWNSSEWVNVSLKLDVKIGEEPTVEVKSDVVDLNVGDVNQSLPCIWTGRPTPEVKWVGPSGGYYETYTDLQKNTVYVRFPEVTQAASGIYECRATSFLANASASVKVNVTRPSNTTTWIIVVAVIVLLLLGIVLPLMYRQYQIILKQREALRFLTDQEIEEFRKGNPDLLREDKYFDETPLLEALPYDSRYEISLRQLSFDREKVIGFGEFGTVFRGIVSPKNEDGSLHYVNLSDMRTHDQRPIEVAIKTCHDDVDVVSFKALLSEIKVMAYLGHSPFIVCLVGACTEKIKDRQVYIAVEFCDKGSLDKILLKCQKESGYFKNLVKYGKLVQDLENDGSKTSHTVSTLDLLSWTKDISLGMEYLQFKRVIHGDLAARNVLITVDNVAKVGDFGLSRQLAEASSDYVKKTQAPLPWRHLAPESLTTLTFSVRSDVWAFGVTIWEIFSLCDRPYSGYIYNVEFVSLLEDGVRLHKPIYATNEIYEFTLKCWSIDPDQRPEYAEVRSICSSALQKWKSRNPAGYTNLEYVGVGQVL